MTTLADILPPFTTVEDAPDALCWQVLRYWRNQQLAACDYTQLPDVDLANKWDWAVYRQALRDMMQQNDDPKLIVFPEPPK